MDIAAWRLCVGCGACVCICPEKKIQLIDVIDQGLRPHLVNNNCDDCDECLKVCPGYQNSLPDFKSLPVLSKNLGKSWGPILEIWEGCATDPVIRFAGSSGGVITALAWYCLDKKNMTGVVHIGADSEKSWKNKTYISQNRADLIQRTGSRYSPASPCDCLSDLESLDGRYVFIGKPCDVSALDHVQKLHPDLVKKVALKIGIFCAGTPATRGILNLLEENQLKQTEVREIRYRGNGWPGGLAICRKGELEPSVKISYHESWSNLQKYRPYRCYLCPDAAGEFADIACGDPWYREIVVNDQGNSLILVRTEEGRDVLHQAATDGYIHLIPMPSEILEKSQQNMLLKRQEIWGRMLAFKLFCIPIPKYRGFHLFFNWWKTSWKTKIRTIFGTLRRIIVRKYYKPLAPKNIIEN